MSETKSESLYFWQIVLIPWALIVLISIVLKSMKIISWSWFWVLSPTWIPAVAIAVALYIFYKIEDIKENKIKPKPPRSIYSKIFRLSIFTLIVFLGLKIFGIIKWGWLWILSPIWIPLTVLFVLSPLLSQKKQGENKIVWKELGTEDDFVTLTFLGSDPLAGILSSLTKQDVGGPVFHYYFLIQR